jgi:hypothetical protein
MVLSWGLVYFYIQFRVSDDHIFHLNFWFFVAFLSAMAAAPFRWLRRRYFGG